MLLWYTGGNLYRGDRQRVQQGELEGASKEAVPGGGCPVPVNQFISEHCGGAVTPTGQEAAPGDLVFDIMLGGFCSTCGGVRWVIPTAGTGLDDIEVIDCKSGE